MIKAIIFDFDGVLVESADIKTHAFRKIFSQWKEKAEEGIAYHMQNMGISRYVKFRYFFENILKQPYTKEIEQELGRMFSEIVIDEIKSAAFVEGIRDFLERNYKNYMFFIASGTPQEELNDIVAYKGIANFFKGIYGSPATKTEIINMILQGYFLDKNQVVFVGDAWSDKKAADDTGIHFVLRATQENKHIACDYKIKDFSQFKRLLEELEICKL